MNKKFVLVTAFVLLATIVVSTILIYTPQKEFFPRVNEARIYSEETIDKKIDVLETQVNLNPDNPRNKVDLGILYFLKGPQYYDKAINLLDASWRQGLSDKRIFYYLGYMYEFLKLYNFAIEEYKKYLTNDPEDLEINIKLANVYYYTGRIDDAIEQYYNILNRHKDNIVVLTNLGTIYFEKGEYSDAQECFAKVKNLCRKKNIVVPAKVNFYLGKIFFLNNNYHSAKQYLEEELSSSPEDVETQSLLAQTYAILNDRQNAISLCEKVLQKDPKNKKIRLLLYNLKKAQTS